MLSIFILYHICRILQDDSYKLLFMFSCCEYSFVFNKLLNFVFKHFSPRQYVENVEKSVDKQRLAV